MCVCQTGKWKHKTTFFSLRANFTDFDHFPCVGLFLNFFVLFFHRARFPSSLFNDDDNNYLIAKYWLKHLSVTRYFLLVFPLFCFIYTWEAFLFICEENWSKRTLDSAYDFLLSSTEISTLYSMKLLCVSSLFAVLEIHRSIVVLNYCPLNYLPYR